MTSQPTSNQKQDPNILVSILQTSLGSCFTSALTDVSIAANNAVVSNTALLEQLKSVRPYIPKSTKASPTASTLDDLIARVSFAKSNLTSAQTAQTISKQNFTQLKRDIVAMISLTADPVA